MFLNAYATHVSRHVVACLEVSHATGPYQCCAGQTLLCSLYDRPGKLRSAPELVGLLPFCAHLCSRMPTESSPVLTEVAPTMEPSPFAAEPLYAAGCKEGSGQVALCPASIKPQSPQVLVQVRPRGLSAAPSKVYITPGRLLYYSVVVIEHLLDHPRNFRHIRMMMSGCMPQGRNVAISLCLVSHAKQDLFCFCMRA